MAMKKIFMILLSAVCFFVSCSQPEEVKQLEGITFNIDVFDITQNEFSFTIEPSDDDVLYYYDVIPVTELTDDASMKLDDLLRFEEMSEESGKTLQDLLLAILSKGKVSKTISDVYPGMTYVIYVYQIDENALSQFAITKKEVNTVGYSGVKIGDFFLVDGSIVSKDSKITDEIREQIAGVVFWLGNPTAEGHDSILGNEHPNCTNGLVMALDTLKSVWGPQKEVDKWVKKDGRFLSVSSGTVESADAQYNRIRGYNNTRAIMEFNCEASERDYVISMDRIFDYRSKVVLPPSTSGWYMPSIKEVSLMITGEYDGDIWDIHAVDGPKPENINIVNESLALIGGVSIVQDSYVSSTEHSQGIVLSARTNNGVIGGFNKFSVGTIRPVFAF